MKLTDQPVAYSAALKAILGCLVLLGAVNLTDTQIVGILFAVESVLGIFVWSSVKPTAAADAQAATARTEGANEAIAGVVMAGAQADEQRVRADTRMVNTPPAKAAPRRRAAAKKAGG